MTNIGPSGKEAFVFSCHLFLNDGGIVEAKKGRDIKNISFIIIHIICN